MSASRLFTKVLAPRCPRVVFAMATLAGARRYGIHFDLLSSGAQQMKDAESTLPEGTSPP